MSDSLFKPRRRWWVFPSRSQPPVPFSVHCHCGQEITGERRSKHQILTCPICQKPVFILPRSPFATPKSAGRRMHGDAPSLPSSFLRTWRMPLIAASITVGVLALLLWFLLPRLGRRPVELQWREHLEAGQRALEEGSFHRALAELQAASRERDRSRVSLTAEETRHLDSLLRQATLLDELLAEPLQDLLRQAAAVRAEEWQHRFERHYRGRTILFDGDLRLDKNGRLELPFLAIEVGAERARPALDDVQLLKLIPLGDSQRVIFGVRLKGFGRDELGDWAIQFEPDSGTLITDATLLTSWRPLLLDGETRGVLKRQEAWARGIKQPPRGS